MKIDRSSAKNILASWMALIAVVTAIVFLVYDSGWAETTRVPSPNRVRMLLVLAVVGAAALANLMGRLLFGGHNSFGAREILSGIFVIGLLVYVGFSYADRYLGGNAVATPDASGVHYLLYEGWGMMFVPLCMVFGVLVMVREGFEKPSLKRKKAA